MKTHKNTITFILIMIIAILNSNAMRVVSPDGNNVLKMRLNSNGTMLYSIKSHGMDVIEESAINIVISDSKFEFNFELEFVEEIRNVIDETYSLPTGKTSLYVNRANESVFIFKNKFGKFIHVICRAYNDGVAFRYVISNLGEITVKKENTHFIVPQNTMSWIMDYDTHNSNYEGFYKKRLLDSIGSEPISYPVLLCIGDKLWILLTEAAVYNQPATHLQKTGKGNELICVFPQEQFSVTSKWESPWRTFILGNKLSTIVESVIVENLNPPSIISNMDWIEPGVAVFPWWGNYMANSYIDTLKAYVDLAAEMNWEWIEFDVALVGSPHRTTDIWKTTEWLSEFIAYAESKGISVYGWDEMNVMKTYAEREYLYGKYKELGIKGIKIDFINSDTQDAMIFRRNAMQDAVEKKLLVSFHGETVPRGQRRTYPNVMTLEAVRGSEYYTFPKSPPPTPEHNCVLPFTRNVIGPMDYTPATFTIRPENPRKTTYAHELALPVIFESGWTAMADGPDTYLNSPAKSFLQQLKSTWDETVYIDGYPGEFICLARRNGNNWYLAAINASEERDLTIHLDFVKEGIYNVTLYKDHPKEPLTNVEIIDQEICSGEMLNVHLKKNGGFCTVLKGKSE